MNKLLMLAISLFKMSADTTEDQAASKMQTLANDLATLETLRIEKTTLETEVKALKLSQQTELVQSAIDSGKILPTQKESFLKLAAGDYASTKEILDAIKPHVSISGRVNLAGNGNGDNQPEWMKDKFVKLTYKELMKTKEGSKILLEMKAGDWDRYADLYKSDYGKEPKK